MTKTTRQAILVLGMHRSGTSALTGVLGLLGARLPARQLPPQPDNPKGFFESEKIAAIHNRMLMAAETSWFGLDPLPADWFRSAAAASFADELTAAVREDFGDAALFVVKDPRICRLLPIWHEVLARLGAEARFAITFRNPLEVAQSLKRRDDLPVAYGCLLWLVYMLEAERHTRGARRVFIRYDELLREPCQTAKRVAEQIGFDNLKISKESALDIAAFIDPAMRHHLAELSELEDSKTFYPWLSKTYRAFIQLSHSATDEQARRRLDKVRAAFDAALESFLTIHEKSLADLQAEFTALKDARADVNLKLSNREAEAARLKTTVAELETATARLERTIRERDIELSDVRTAATVSHAKVYSLETTISQIYASTSWRVTAPLRFLRRTIGSHPTTGLNALRAGLRILPRVITRFAQILRGAIRHVVQRRAQPQSSAKLIKQSLGYMRSNGLTATINRLLETPSWTSTHTPNGRALIDARYEALAEDARERFFAPPKSFLQISGPRISILMPVYKTPPQYLEAAINSVCRQIYQDWELCLVDDGSQSAEIEQVLTSYSYRDPRIKFKTHEFNKGISSATNTALAMATGQFIGLVDHDDLLTCDALYHVAQVLEENPELDFIYSDECKIDENGRADDLFLKPDWDAFLLLNFMYTGHFSVYRRSLVVELGGFRPDFDFSQDYDLALRVTEKTSRIHHVERILYGWRKAIGSAAVGGKDFARASNVAALQSAMERRRYRGQAIALPTGNRVIFDRAECSTPVSIIVPSDDEGHITQSVEAITQKSSYPHYEIVVVTKSEIIVSVRSKVGPRVKFCAFDDVFNFSAKCNAGAGVSTGPILIFFNDDVRVISPDWIECLIDYLALGGVGAVSPKLLYEDDSIQHAGLVTGVRGLVGTAFHCLPADSMRYFNLAQSVRNVSALSGACLAVRREVFETVNGFDAKRYPIAHSDVDLCLKIRRANLQCVYNPFATLRHIGHASLKASTIDRTAGQKDRADIHLLQDWSREVARDPFWNRAMRNILYRDSPESFEVFPPIQSRKAVSGRNILLVFHDLSNSGAPRVLFEAARHLIAAGHFIVAVSPTDGFYRDELRKLGATVIVDELLLRAHPAVEIFARNFDLAIVNTVVSWPFILQNASKLDCYWYLHEADAILDYANNDPKFREAIRASKAVWVTGKRAKKLTDHLRPDIAVIECGLSPPMQISSGDDESRLNKSSATKIGVFGSYEPRKGQDLAVAAMPLLPESLLNTIELNFFGRVLDQSFLDDVKHRAAGNPAINFGPELNQADCLAELERCDIVLISSRDESMSLVGLDAIAAGKIVVCSPAVGLSNYLRSGENAFIAKSPAPEDLAHAITEVFLAKARWPCISANAQHVFNQTFTEAAFRDRILRALALT